MPGHEDEEVGGVSEIHSFLHVPQGFLLAVLKGTNSNTKLTIPSVLLLESCRLLRTSLSSCVGWRQQNKQRVLKAFTEKLS